MVLAVLELAMEASLVDSDSALLGFTYYYGSLLLSHFLIYVVFIWSKEFLLRAGEITQ